VDIRVPESLLFDVQHLRFSRYDLTVGPESPAGAREKAFFENYQREFSWGEGWRPIQELMTQFQSVPAELRALVTSFGLEPWLAEPNPQTVAERYFGSHAIHYGDRAVVMPVLELCNHGEGTTYTLGDGIRLSGRFDGEIFARYDLTPDSLQIFESWGFAPPEDAALSLKLGLESAGIVIRREHVKPVLVQGVPFIPDVSMVDGKITFSHLLLGHRKYPKIAKGIFYRFMRNAGRSHADAEALFDTIVHANRTQFHRLLALSEEAPLPLGRLLRNLARFQLEAMSNAIGAGGI
jgi:hypothetical protein